MVDGELRGDVNTYEVSVREGRVRLRRRRGPRAESLRSLAAPRLTRAVAPTEDWING